MKKIIGGLFKVTPRIFFGGGPPTLLLLILTSVMCFGQVSDATLTTQNTNEIRNKVYAPTRAADFNQSLIDSKANRAEVLTASGTNTYTVTANVTFTYTSTKPQLLIRFTNANTGASTLNVNSLGAKTIVSLGNGVLQRSDIIAGGVYWLCYDGTNFQLTPTIPAISTPNSYTASGIDTYTISNASGIGTSYASGYKVLVKFTSANTGAATLNINSIGAVSIKKNGSTALSAGDINAGQTHWLTYDGTNFQIVGPNSSSTSAADKLSYLPGFKVTKISNALFTYGRAGGQMVQVGNWLYHIAGTNSYRGMVHDSVVTNQIWRANVSDLTSWTLIKKPPFYGRFCFGKGVNGNLMYVWGLDYLSAFAGSGPSTPDCWEGTVNLNTGNITWVKTNNAIPYTVSAPTPKVQYAGFMDDAGCLYTFAGMCDDEFKGFSMGLPINTQCPNENETVFKSCDRGITWSKVSDNWNFSHRGFKKSDTLRARTLYGTTEYFNNQIVTGGGGDFSNGTHYSWDNVIFRSLDKGVTIDSLIYTTLVEGVQNSASVVTKNWMFWIGGTKYDGTTAGTETNLIQYIDTTFSAHAINERLLPARTLPAATKVVINGVERGLFIYGGYKSNSDTTLSYLNDAYYLEFADDRKVSQGDNVEFRELAVRDSVQASFYNPKDLLSSTFFNKGLGIKLTPLVSQPPVYFYTFGRGDINQFQEYRFQYIGVNMIVGADVGTSGGGVDNYETSTITANTDKLFQMQMPTYASANAKPDFFGLLAGATIGSTKYLVIGHDSGLDVAMGYPSRVKIGVASVDGMIDMTSSGILLKNDIEVPVGKRLYLDEGSGGFAGQTTLVTGTKAITISGTTTGSRAILTLVSPGGTVTTTWQYKAVCTSSTLTITAIKTDGSTNTSDTSILNYWIFN